MAGNPFKFGSVVDGKLVSDFSAEEDDRYKWLLDQTDWLRCGHA